MTDLIRLIESSSFMIAILNPILERTDQLYELNNRLNAIKMFGFGVAYGLGRNTLLFQKGDRNYSDVVSLTEHYTGIDTFTQVLTHWSSKITSQTISQLTIARRIGIPRFGNLVRRQRLNDIINKNLFSNIIVIRTPSGYGKSGLVAQCVSDNQYPVIWYTFDQEKIETADFIGEMLSTLNKLNSRIGVNLLSIMSSFSRRELNESNLIGYFLSELRAFEKKLLIVLDDVHLTNGTPLLQQFKMILENLPQNIGLLLLSREDLGTEIRHLVGKQCVELKKDELEFNKEEIREYISAIFGLSLTPMELDLLQMKSEGWIASISLLQTIVAQKGKEAIPAIISRLSGTDVNIYNYFAEIVYDCFEDRLKELLLKTSVLNNLTVSSVSFLMSNTPEEAEYILKDLERKNSFLFNFDYQPNVYRYHSLFKEFLQDKYEFNVGSANVRELKAKLSDFYISNKEFFEAINLGIAGKNYSTTVKAIVQVGPYIVNEGLGRMLVEWFNQVPLEYYNNDYDLLILNGQAHEQIGKIDHARILFNTAQSVLGCEEGKEKEKNLVRFMIHRVKMVQDSDVNKLEKENLNIMNDAKHHRDENTYYGAAESYFQLKWQTLAHQQQSGSIDLAAYEIVVQHIDSVLAELSNSPLKYKNIHRSQLLVSKAKIVHFIAGLKAARAITISELNKITHLNPNYERRKQSLDEILQAYQIEEDCLTEALTISENDKQLLLKANILTEKAELMASKYHLTSMLLSPLPIEFVDTILIYYYEALKIYSTLYDLYGIALVYNNVANTFLLKNDKANRDKYANLAIDIARKQGFSVIESKANQILAMPTLDEMKMRAPKEATRSLEEGMSEAEKDRFFEMMIGSVGDFPVDEKERRKSILRLEFEDDELLRSLQKNWCKYIEMFDTANPLSKHPSVDKEMVVAYLAEELVATQLYDSMRTDFGKQINAKFLYCHLLGHYSDGLEERIKSLSDKFVTKYCKYCTKREIEN
jgi:hypothetical protein